jgi:hypothetical protein
VRAPPDDIAAQLGRAYRTMAARARYRPSASSDGLGHITGRLDMGRECRDYAADWWAEADSLVFHVGCCNFETRPATVYLIEAARALCGASDGLARDMLRLATEELDGQEVAAP